MKKHQIALGLMAALSSNLAFAAEDALSFYGDFRLRFEQDWDSQRGNGVERDDRARLRIRLRGGLNYQLNDNLKFGLRARSGSTSSQQSPHITLYDFDNNDKGDKQVALDKWFANYNFDLGDVWVGRNSSPFWQQNELFWDDDVTLAGIGGHIKINSETQINAGYFALPDGMTDFAGSMWGVQLQKNLTADTKLAFGWLNTDGEDSVENLNLNFANRDYEFITASFQTGFELLDLPGRIGFDYYRNSDAESSESDGYVFNSQLGKLSSPGDWQLRYDYARIEKYAVHPSYAQDDWFRFGSATQTSSSDFKGHEFRVSYKYSKPLNVVARLYLVEAISSIQDGNRFRIDFNYKF